MHHELVTMAISGISPAVTFDEFRFRSMIFNESVAKDVLDFLKDHGIGSESNDIIIFCEADRLKTGLIALQMGADIEMISNALSWRDFEALTLKMLHSLGYVTETNIRLTKPHREIDVLGVNSRFAIVVDCKHWKRSNLSLLSMYAKKQVQRTELLLKRKKNLSFAVPILLTLHSEKVQFIDKVPVVPINKFESFLEDFQGYLPEIHVISVGKLRNNGIPCL